MILPILLITLLTIVLIRLIGPFLWKQCRVYYYCAKIPGPYSVSRILELLQSTPEETYNVVAKFLGEHAPVSKLWMGSNVYVSSTRVKDVEHILTKCLHKGEFYQAAFAYYENTLIAAPYGEWKANRVALEHGFKPNVVNQSVPTFVKEANILVTKLEEGKELNIFRTIWMATLRISIEALMGVNPESLRGKTQFLEGLIKYKKLWLQRVYDRGAYLIFFWRFEAVKKRFATLNQDLHEFVQKVIKHNRLAYTSNKSEIKDSDFALRTKLFLNILLDPKQGFSPKHIQDEIPPTLVASSESSAVTISSALLMLGLNQDIQEKVFEELDRVFIDKNETMTIEQINSLDYLERVIKETLRLFSPITLMLRSLEEDVQLDEYLLPAGCNFVVVVKHIHRNPEYYPDPLKFNPDRFLPEEVAKRPRWSYMPFSMGSRNCIGAKFAMVELKVCMAAILRRYKVVKVLDYEKVEDVDFVFAIIAQAKKGYRVVLEKKE